MVWLIVLHNQTPWWHVCNETWQCITMLALFFTTYRQQSVTVEWVICINMQALKQQHCFTKCIWFCFWSIFSSSVWLWVDQCQKFRVHFSCIFFSVHYNEGIVSSYSVSVIHFHNGTFTIHPLQSKVIHEIHHIPQHTSCSHIVCDLITWYAQHILQLNVMLTWRSVQETGCSFRFHISCQY